MAMGSPGGGSGAISDINVTPLVDVMLVLLIIFMVTATLIKPIEESPGSEFDLPVTRYNDAFIDIHATDKMILFIGPNLRVYLGNPSVEEADAELITDCSAAVDRPSVESFMPCLTEIGQKLGQNYRLSQDREIYIHADRGVPYGFVNGTLAHLRNAGVDRVGMITNPDYNLE